MDTDQSEKVILLATDFSRASERALAEAVRMAELLSARLAIVHVCHCSLFTWEGELAKVVRAASRLEALRARVAERVPCDAHLVSGDPVSGILEGIDGLRPSLVIIGSSGHGPMRRAFVGSLSERLRRRSPVRVMVAPAPPRTVLGPLPRIDPA